MVSAQASQATGVAAPLSALWRVARITGLLILLAAGLRVLATEASRYRLLAPGETMVTQVVPVGRFVLLEPVAVHRLQIGDVVSYHHPLRERGPALLRVGAITPIPGSTGYAVRLDAGDAAEPWHAELHGTIARVVLTAPELPRALSSPPDGRTTVAVGAGLTALVGALLALRARRRRKIGRSYRVDLW